MPAETVTYIADLDVTAPTGASPKSEGDDHIRNGKAAAKNSFAGFTGAILTTGVDGGAVNTYTLTPAPALPAYSARMVAVFSPIAQNTGPATLNISGLGAKSIVSVSGAPLGAGDLAAGRFYAARYDGTKFSLDSVTQNYIDQLVISGSVPGVSDPANAGKVFGSTGTIGQWVALDGRGAPTKDKGNSGTTAQVINYADGEGQTITATGTHTLTATGFPVGRLAGILLRMIAYGSYPPVTTGITWIKADGTMTANFASSGIVLSTGTSQVVLYSFGDGVVYGKAA